MGICREARRSGAKEERKMHSADRASTGSRSQGENPNFISLSTSLPAAQTVRTPNTIPGSSDAPAISQASRLKSRRTCRRVAPTARSMPISSVLWDRTPSIAPEMPTHVASSRHPPMISHRIICAIVFSTSIARESCSITCPSARLTP